MITSSVPTRTITLLLILALAGCAGLQRAPEAPDTRTACLWLFENSDREIRAARVGDGGAARIAGFPWLRTNRFLSSFRDQLESPEQFHTWVEHLSNLDREARGSELRNLNASRLQSLQHNWDSLAARQQLPEPLDEAFEHCRTTLVAELRSDHQAQNSLRSAAVTPDAYNTWQRVLGLYPLARAIARPRIELLHERLQQTFEGDGADLRRYAVPDAAHSPAQSAALVQQPTLDPLGIPLPDAANQEALFNAYAPVWSVDTQSDADLPGALVLDIDHRPKVDTGQGVEYRWLSWSRFGEQVLLQLNYLLWFPERPPETLFDITAGILDGVIWRVTLDGEGGVLAYDSIHPCGCYYTLFPGEGWQVASIHRDQEAVFAPSAAPVPGPGERLEIVLSSGTRYFVDVTVRAGPVSAQTLRPVPVSDLQSLPLPGGARGSVYEPNGLIAVSRRPERFLFWPLGIPSAGTMRQPGTQAIAFVGRRHFDDAYLLQDLLIRRTGE